MEKDTYQGNAQILINTLVTICILLKRFLIHINPQFSNFITEISPSSAIVIVYYKTSYRKSFIYGLLKRIIDENDSNIPGYQIIIEKTAYYRQMQHPQW